MKETQALRSVFGKYATGVAVVTAVDHQDNRAGMTINSFSSVSLTPPLILFSIAKTAHSSSVFSNARSYAVNVLHEQQADVCLRFSRALGDKWSAGDWKLSADGVPLICGALAIFECNKHAIYDGGDHDIILGRVTRFSESTDSSPLIFFAGSFHFLGTEKCRQHL